MRRVRGLLTNVWYRGMGRVRAFFGRDMKYEIVPGYSIVLPPEHMLPLYQKVHPLYDRYFLDFFSAIGESHPRFTLVDIGANVGDTTVAVKSAAPESQVLCVEGSAFFLPYLRQNVHALPDVEVVDFFVSAGRDESLQYSHANGTGRLAQATGATASASQLQFVSVDELLAKVDDSVLTVWKSDTDGHDVGILLAGFEQVVARSEIIWFELMLLPPYEPSADELADLLHKIGKLDRDIVIVDNFGRVMLHLAAASAPRVITDLGRWLRLQRSSGTVSIDYFDVWVMSSAWAEKLVQTIPSE